MRLISSNLALQEAVALAAGGEMSLANLARAVEATPSSSHRALSVLLDDGVAARSRKPPLFGLRDHPLAEQVVDLALAALPLETAAGIAGRANPAIEFIAVDSESLVVVFSSHTQAELTSLGAAISQRLAQQSSLRVCELDHREVRDELLVRPELRDEMRRLRVVHGELDRSFPDRSRHGTTAGHVLGRPHPSLPRPSRRYLGRLAKRHGLRSLSLFGSSVRSDFRRDSDVDVLVSFRPGQHPSLGSLVNLENDLAAAFDRDVDVVRVEGLASETRERLRANAVLLL